MTGVYRLVLERRGPELITFDRALAANTPGTMLLAYGLAALLDLRE